MLLADRFQQGVDFRRRIRTDGGGARNEHQQGEAKQRGEDSAAHALETERVSQSIIGRLESGFLEGMDPPEFRWPAMGGR
jgi:hypothetical protein